MCPLQTATVLSTIFMYIFYLKKMHTWYMSIIEMACIYFTPLRLAHCTDNIYSHVLLIDLHDREWEGMNRYSCAQDISSRSRFSIWNARISMHEGIELIPNEVALWMTYYKNGASFFDCVLTWYHKTISLLVEWSLLFWLFALYYLTAMRMV